MSASRRLSLQACVVLLFGATALTMPEQAQANSQVPCSFCLSSCPANPNSYCMSNCPKYPEGSCVEFSLGCKGAPRLDCNYPK